MITKIDADFFDSVYTLHTSVIPLEASTLMQSAC